MAGIEFEQPSEGRKARADRATDWLEGRDDRVLEHDGPRQNPKNPKIEVSIEVGERRKQRIDGELVQGPGLTRITSDDKDSPHKVTSRNGITRMWSEN